MAANVKRLRGGLSDLSVVWGENEGGGEDMGAIRSPQSDTPSPVWRARPAGVPDGLVPVSAHAPE